MTGALEEYIRSTGPYSLWEALLGCRPEDSDVLQGAESDAATMIEEVLQGIEKDGLSTQEIGLPEPRKEIAGEDIARVIRTKLMSGVVLSATSTRSARNAFSASREAEGSGMAAGILCIIGNLDEMDAVLPQIYPEIPAKVTRRLRTLTSPPAMRISGGEPRLEIRFRPKEHLGAFLSDMVEAAVGGVLAHEYDDAPLYRLPDTDVAYLPDELTRLDEDDVERINAIAAHCGERIDSEGCTLKRAFASAPYRKTLVQNLVERVTDLLATEMERYGARRNDSSLTLEVPKGSDLGPVLYRMFGDPGFDLEGLLCQEVVQSVSIALPELPKDAPETFLLPPRQALLSEFFMFYGGADACLCMWDTESQIPARYVAECGPIHSVVPLNTTSVDAAIEEISSIFQRDAFGPIE